MTLEIVIPEREAKKSTVKDMIFAILAEGNPKTLTQLHREMKRRYGVGVSFQAVIKAVRNLLEHRVLNKSKRIYSLNKEWIFETRSYLDKLYIQHFKVVKPLETAEFSKEVTVYKVGNLLELDRLWNGLLANWAKSEKEDKRNVWQGNHCWWLIPRLQEEDALHDLFIEHRVKTYNLINDGTTLDKLAVKYYSKKGENAKIRKRKTDADRHLSIFGSYIVRFEIPRHLADKLEEIYQKTKKIEELDLKNVLDIFKKNLEIEEIVIDDRVLADALKEKIILDFQITSP